ncbi:hypothetical protein B0H19DRAFT_1086345 [Mycena capillaripes]|nr:hypothetical protein B0H19DRAFT_1086345 [Mycena capillaripes]
MRSRTRTKKKARTDAEADKDRKNAATDLAKKRTEQGPINRPFDELVDDPPPPPPTTAVAAQGRPKTGLLDQLTILCHTKSTNTGRICYAGDGCHKNWALPRQSGRILPHLSACWYLLEELKKHALLVNAKASLSSKLESQSSRTNTDMFSNFCQAACDGNKAAARKAHINRTNLFLLNFLRDAAVGPYLVDDDSFRTFSNHLEPWNDIYVATFSTNYIPTEAAKVTVLTYDLLKTCHNLTISHDGGTTKNHQSIYTVHVTTPEREAFLITSEHIKNVLTEVVNKVGPKHFAAIESNSTGNTKWARETKEAAFPTLLIVPDPCHHLSDTIGGIVALPYFVNVRPVDSPNLY